eukprot:Gb_39421 [translate_table: standard]
MFMSLIKPLGAWDCSMSSLDLTGLTEGLFASSLSSSSEKAASYFQFGKFSASVVVSETDPPDLFLFAFMPTSESKPSTLTTLDFESLLDPWKGSLVRPDSA